MDITLQIMYTPPNHTEVGDPYIDDNVFRKGDVLAVYRDIDCPESPSVNSRSVFIRVTGVPISVIKKVKHIGESEKNENFEDIRGRLWFIPRVRDNLLPQAMADALEADREITVTWTQAKGEIKNKTTSAYATDVDIQ